MEWYALLILLDLWILSRLTGALMNLIFGQELVAWAEIRDPGLHAILYVVPRLAVYGFYLTWCELPMWPAFRTWRGWNLWRTWWLPVEPAVYPFEPKRTEDQEAERGQTLYAVIPHGVFGEAVIPQFVLNPRYISATTMVTSLLQYIPIARELSALAGCVPATASNLTRVLDEGRSVVILPGGLREILHRTDEDDESLSGPCADRRTGRKGVWNVLNGGTTEQCRPRKGFVRYALSSQCAKDISIVPVYVENTHALYRVWSIPWLRGLQHRLLRKWLYPFPVLVSGWWGTCLPKREPIRCLFGRAIALSPTNQTEDEVFDRVAQELHKLMYWDPSTSVPSRLDDARTLETHTTLEEPVHETT